MRRTAAFLSTLFLSSLFLSAIFLPSCNQPSNQTEHLQAQIDSLQIQLKKSFRPGMGELMTNIQIHHAKLWFAGDNQNWPLANYQESLIVSAFKRIQLYHGNQPEAKLAAMIDPALDSVDHAIQQKNHALFQHSFSFLTNTCNSCHQATKHPYNVITIPTVPPIGNQSYK
jgi:hypothetical protein